MVRAILAGRKTQTRRVVKPQPFCADVPGYNPIFGYGVVTNPKSPVCGRFAIYARFQCDDRWLPCPYGKTGDRLWVKETFAVSSGDNRDEKNGKGNCAVYRATWNDGVLDGLWKPSIFMPRYASRITLEVVSVRVERLQEISEADAIAEGIERSAAEFKNYDATDKAFRWLGGCGAAVLSYKTLWESINGEGSWNLNPWVWVVEFKREGGV